jgi:hypothetical protein
MARRAGVIGLPPLPCSACPDAAVCHATNTVPKMDPRAPWCYNPWDTHPEHGTWSQSSQSWGGGRNILLSWMVFLQSWGDVS